MAETPPQSPARGCVTTVLTLVVAFLLVIWLGQWLHHRINAMKERAEARRLGGVPSARAPATGDYILPGRQEPVPSARALATGDYILLGRHKPVPSARALAALSSQALITICAQWHAYLQEIVAYKAQGGPQDAVLQAMEATAPPELQDWLRLLIQLIYLGDDDPYQQLNRFQQECLRDMPATLKMAKP